MPQNIPVSLLALPVELIYRISDYLDTRTITFSLRCVCTRLRTITNTYERFRLDLRSTSKPEFHQICRLIFPEHVISLTLSDDDETSGQIDLFFSLLDIHRFSRLRSLALYAINDDSLEIILHHTIRCPLISLSIEHSRPSNHRSATLHLLSSAMARSDLRKFTCTSHLLFSDGFHWPTESHVEHLTLDRCTRKEFSIILRHLPRLRTILMHHFNLDIHEEHEDLSAVYPKLISLTLRHFFLSMDEIESLLLLTPSLVHLRLEGSADDAVFHADRWETLIRTTVPSLDRFEFCFRSQNHRVIQGCALRFRTSFWRDEKRWPVHCLYDHAMEEMLLCSATDFITEFEYHFVGPVVVSTTMHNADKRQSSQFFLRRIAELELSEYAMNSFDHLKQLIDLSQVVKLRISLSDRDAHISRAQEMMTDLFKEAIHMRSLAISFEPGFAIDSLLMETICSLTPDHVKHLDIEVTTLPNINLTLDRLRHLSSITLRRLPPLPLLSTSEWYTSLRAKGTYRHHQDTLHIWLDKSLMERDRTPKRET